MGEAIITEAEFLSKLGYICYGTNYRGKSLVEENERDVLRAFVQLGWAIEQGSKHKKAVKNGYSIAVTGRSKASGDAKISIRPILNTIKRLGERRVRLICIRNKKLTYNF